MLFLQLFDMLFDIDLSLARDVVLNALMPSEDAFLLLQAVLRLVFLWLLALLLSVTAVLVIFGISELLKATLL